MAYRESQGQLSALEQLAEEYAEDGDEVAHTFLSLRRHGVLSEESIMLGWIRHIMKERTQLLAHARRASELYAEPMTIRIEPCPTCGKQAYDTLVSGEKKGGE